MTKNFILEIKNKLTETEGSALMAVVILFLVMMILVGTGSTLALSNYKKSKAAKENHSAYYLAESQIKEFSDKMLDHLENLSTTNKEKYSKFTKEEMAQAINDAIIPTPTLRAEPTIMNQKTDTSSVQLVPSLTEEDSYSIKSTAVVDKEQRSLNQNVKYIIKSFQKGVGDESSSGNSENQDYGFIEKYGLIVKEELELGNSRFESNVFLLNKNINKARAKISGQIDFLKRNGEDSFFYSSSSKSSKQLFEDVFFRGKWNSPFIEEKFIKSNEAIIDVKKLEFPSSPDKNKGTTQRIDEDIIETLPNPNNSGIVENNRSFSKNKQDVSLIWKRGSGLINLSKTESFDYAFKKLHVNEFNENAYNSLLYIDVGDKDVHFVVDDFDIKGGLLVLGSGSLTIHTTKKDDYEFKPFMFTGLDKRIHEKNSINKFTVKNNLVLSLQSKEEMKIKQPSRNNAQFHATIIANYIDFDKPWDNKTSVNIFSLGRFKDVDQKIFLPTNNQQQEGMQVFIYSPYAKIESEAASHFRGFIYIGEIKDTSYNLKFVHDIEFINNLPPSVHEVISQITGIKNDPGNNGPDIEPQKIEFHSIQEVTP